MPKLAFFVAGASTGVGATALILAWDRFGLGPSAADDLAPDGVGLYTWMGLTTGAQLIRAKTKSPVEIPEDDCPKQPDGFPDRDLVARVEIKASAQVTPIVDCSFELFDGSTRVYGAAPEGKVLKVELADGSFGLASILIQDRLVVQPWEDPLEGLASLINYQDATKELWRALMTPNQPVPSIVIGGPA